MTDRTDRTLAIVQALSTAIALPVFSAYTLRLFPPALDLRWAHEAAPTASLGFAWRNDAVLPAARQTAGLEDLAAVALALASLALLVGCSSLATLVARRGLGRRRELSVRAAVGATRRQLLTEVMGGLGRPLALGAAAGVAGGGVLLWIAYRTVPDVLIAPALPVSALSPVAVLAPIGAAFLAARTELGGVLRHMRSPISLGPPNRIVQLGLGGLYLAVLVTLLTTAFVLTTGTVDPEASVAEWPEARDTLVIELGATGSAEAIDLWSGLSAEEGPLDWHLASSGTLEGLGVADPTLAECNCASRRSMIPAPFRRMLAQHHSVTPGLFRTLGVPVLRGREFTSSDDAAAERVAVIDRALSHLFLRVDPIGKVIRIGGRDGRGPWYRIVGIVDPPPSKGLATSDEPIGSVYLSALQNPSVGSVLIARGRVTDEPASRRPGTPVERAVVAERAAAALQRAGLAPPAVTSWLSERLVRLVRPIGWFGALIGLVGLAALVIAARGLASLTALEVHSRIPELGVRRALGARARDVRRLVWLEVGQVLAVGAVLGMIGSVGFTVGLADRFRAVESFDPGAAGIVVALLVLAAAAGARGPARVAERVVPIDAIGAAQD